MTPALFTSVGLRRSPHTPADDRRKAHGWRPLNCFELRPDFVEHGHDSRRSRAAVLDDRVGPRTSLENRTVTDMWAEFWSRSTGGAGAPIRSSQRPVRLPGPRLSQSGWTPLPNCRSGGRPAERVVVRHVLILGTLDKGCGVGQSHGFSISCLAL
jgi:hypothetical protein